MAIGSPENFVSNNDIPNVEDEFVDDIVIDSDEKSPEQIQKSFGALSSIISLLQITGKKATKEEETEIKKLINNIAESYGHNSIESKIQNIHANIVKTNGTTTVDSVSFTYKDKEKSEREIIINNNSYRNTTKIK